MEAGFGDRNWFCGVALALASLRGIDDRSTWPLTAGYENARLGAGVMFGFRDRIGFLSRGLGSAPCGPLMQVKIAGPGSTKQNGPREAGRF